MPLSASGERVGAKNCGTIHRKPIIPNSSTNDSKTMTTVAVCHSGANARASGRTTKELRVSLSGRCHFLLGADGAAVTFGQWLVEQGAVMGCTR